MRDINEVTAEVFRRSDKRIKERKQNRNRIKEEYSAYDAIRGVFMNRNTHFATRTMQRALALLAVLVLLVGMLVAGGSPWIVIGVATVGNFLGGLTSYGIGRIGKWEWIEKLGVKPETMAKHKAKIDRYGAWLALLSWVPFVGDVFAVALGFYRTKFVPSALFMLVGKFGRFVAWYGLWLLTTTR